MAIFKDNPGQLVAPLDSEDDLIVGKFFCGWMLFVSRGVARNSFWVGIILLLHDTLQSYTSSLTTSAAISAQNNFQGLILGGYIYRYTPRRYAPGL